MIPKNQFTEIAVPVFELDSEGCILPNPLFHRAWDKLHSRCVEYPFAASKVGASKVILDVGTTKADSVWVNWLDNLPIVVHATDYDPLPFPVTNINFHQSDVRNLQIEDDFFDKILAVSVIEHIGLENPQVNTEVVPSISAQGDEDAFCELVRVLKHGGEIVMTFPFGNLEELILGGSARNYTLQTIRRFEKYARPVVLDYYEYQFAQSKDVYLEYPPPKSKYQQFRDLFVLTTKKTSKKYVGQLPAFPGIVTWRRISLSDAQSTQWGHVDGVLCGVWRKE